MNERSRNRRRPRTGLYVVVAVIAVMLAAWSSGAGASFSSTAQLATLVVSQ